jgi:hypothetical protein
VGGLFGSQRRVQGAGEADAVANARFLWPDQRVRYVEAAAVPSLAALPDAGDAAERETDAVVDEPADEAEALDAEPASSASDEADDSADITAEPVAARSRFDDYWSSSDYGIPAGGYDYGLPGMGDYGTSAADSYDVDDVAVR